MQSAIFFFGGFVKPVVPLLVALMVSSAPGSVIAQETGPDPTVQCLPWDVPQNVLDGEGASDWDLYQRPVGTVRGAVLFVDFTDAPATETTQEVFDQVVAPSVPLYESSSYGVLDLEMEALREWIRMSKPSGDYKLSRDDTSTFEEDIAYIAEAVDLADARFDFSETDLLYVVASANVDANFSPQTTAFPGDGVVADGNELRLFATMGTDTRNEFHGHRVLPHETGHMFSLPDLYTYTGSDRDRHRFAGAWDIMGDYAWGGFTAWHKLKLGWLGAGDVACIGPGSEAEVRLAPLGVPGGTKAAIVRTGPSTGYVAEVRRPVGTDMGICDYGVLVYEVDTSIPPGEGPLRVRGAGGEPERTDVYCEALGDAAFDVGEETVFEDAASGVRIEVLSTQSGSYTIRVVNDGDFDATEPVTYTRSVSASFSEGTRLAGSVAAAGDAVGCRREVVVKVQRRTPRGFKTVATAFTNREGAFDVAVANAAGKRFRALVPASQFSTFSRCGKAVSPVVAP